MKGQLDLKSRKKVQAKMATVFGDKIRTLSTEYQKMLLDDLVTAFENRLTVLNRKQENMHSCIEVNNGIELENGLG